MEIRLATGKIQKDSIVDGEGIRSVIWTQGCNHHCKGCHNPKTHSFNGGRLYNIEDLKNQIDLLEGQDGITFSGGDPMEQAKSCAILARYSHQKGLNVWCYTGYTYEELIEKSKEEKSIRDFLEQIDVLVDGRFILSEKSYDVKFRGSKNQRIIDVRRSLSSNKVVLISEQEEQKEDKIYNTIRKNHYLFV